MICQEYEQMNAIEKRDFVGSLIHSCISDSVLFNKGKKLIAEAEKKGLFEGVKINPTDEVPETSCPNSTG